MSGIGQLIQPSQFSVTGKWLTMIDGDHCLNPELHGVVVSELPTVERIGFFAFKVLSAIILIGCTVADLASWVGMTITVIPAYRIGCLNHVANLIATLAVPFLAIGMVFGRNLTLHNDRPFFCPVDFTQQKTRYSSLEFVNHIQGSRLEQLIDRGVDIDQVDAQGNTPLVKILLRGYDRDTDPDEVAKKVSLLLGAGANPDPKSGTHFPLMLAAALGLARTVEALLKKNADSRRVDQQGFSTLDQVITSRYLTGDINYSTRLYPRNKNQSRTQKRFADDNVDMAVQLIKADVALYDSHLDELEELCTAIKGKNVDDVIAIMQRDDARTHHNPYIQELIKEIKDHTEVNDRDSIRQFFFTHQIFLANFMVKFNWVIANKDNLKSRKAAIINGRTNAVAEALKSCSENGMPQPLVEMISHYCYC